ncbi:MAG: right-handed parallel beta-helix repeat-containing protein, partial [Clostridia bacterium]|nr:right-handed parallel beta-helix repeat-containing protein [Clostridia bacterium]
KARDAVRALKAEKPGKAIKVAFMAGNYGTLDNIKFTAEDSGTADAPITYCKYGDGDVVFANGIKIDEESFKPVDESDYYLLGSVDTSKVYKADLNGIIDRFEDNNVIFSETTLCYEARIPNKNANGVDVFYTDVTTTHNELESIELQVYLPGIVEKFRTVEGMKVTGLLRYGWLLDTFLVKSYDKESHILTFDFENTKIYNGYDIKDGHVLAYEDRFDDTVFFHNLSDQIDFEGEYWFDTKTKTLYMYEPKGDYHISTGGTFMYIAPGAEHISFVGLDFSTSTSNGIEIAADNLTFDRCTFSNIAGNAAIGTVFYENNESGARGLTVTRCEFFNFVNMALDIEASYQDYRKLKPSGNVIDNNYFHDFGSPQFMSKAVMLHWNVGAQVTHNEFTRASESAIVWEYCCDTVIEYNVFDDLMRSSTDRGVLYCYEQITNRSNVIRYNLFKNTRNATQVHSIYFDGSWGHEVYNNLFYNSASCNVLFNGGRDNSACNNVMIGNITPFISHKGLDPNQSPEEYKNSAAFRYLGALPAKETSEGQLWYARWPSMYEYSYDPADVGKPECVFTTVNHVKNNALIGAKIDDKVLLESGDLEGNVEYALTDDVGFVCPALGDYRIKDGASVDSVQFENIGRY